MARARNMSGGARWRTRAEIIVDRVDSMTIDNQTLRQTTADWLCKMWNSNTREQYSSALRDWLRWCAKHDADPIKARRADIDQYLDRMRWVDSRRARRVTALSSWYRHLAHIGLVAADPTRELNADTDSP